MSITSTIQYSSLDFFSMHYQSTVFREGFTHQQHKSFRGLDDEKVMACINPLASSIHNKKLSLFYFKDNLYFVLDLYKSELIITQFSNVKQAELSEHFLYLCDLLNIEPTISNDKFTVTFTSYDSGRGYVSYSTKQLDGSSLDSVLDNYGAEVQQHIKLIRDIKKIKKNGKLIILNGKPGTGKTHLLRSLLKEWQTDILSYYITDPENLLRNPEYLTQIISDQKKSIIIMEDCDFFISKQSKTEYTQSASRLLNTLDGLLGQGMDFVFILTANEDIKNIHEAFSRKGRCLANIPFEGLNYDEAKKWCEKHNVNIENVSSSNSNVGLTKTNSYYTLADLYDLIEQEDHQYGQIIDVEEEDLIFPN